MDWGTPAEFFMDQFWRWFCVLFIVYYVIRNVIGHAVQFITFIGK